MTDEQFATARDAIKNRGEITLGELLALVGYVPENVPKFQEFCIIDIFGSPEDWTQFDLDQTGVHEDFRVWDGEIRWNADTREFSYVGADGPSGGSYDMKTKTYGPPLSLPLTPSSVFEIG